VTLCSSVNTPQVDLERERDARMRRNEEAKASMLGGALAMVRQAQHQQQPEQALALTPQPAGNSGGTARPSEQEPHTPQQCAAQPDLLKSITPAAVAQDQPMVRAVFSHDKLSLVTILTELSAACITRTCTLLCHELAQ
jgi:hypothetical protein